MSAIPEIREVFDPASEQFGGFLAQALSDTRMRFIEAYMSELDQRAQNGDEAAAVEYDGILLHGSSAIGLDLPRKPDPADYKEAAAKREDEIGKLVGHAEIAVVPYTGRMATFVVITPEEKCIYGIGPEESVSNYLRLEGFKINSATIDGLPVRSLSNETNRRPDMPNPFEWYVNYSEQYPGPLDGGSYIDVVQQPDMHFQPSGDN